MAAIIVQSSSMMASRLTPIADALAHLLSCVRKTDGTEVVALATAGGRVLAADITATLAVPGYDNSAMDGYAVKAADCGDATRALTVTQTIAAGHPGRPVGAGMAARIFTGAPIPAGADAVVMQENVRREGEKVYVLQAPSLGENIRREGHDIALGSSVLKQGRRLQPQDLGLLASLGLASVQVYQPLTVALVNTGDEVVQQGQSLKPGQLYDSNSFTLAGLLQQLGMRVVKVGIIGDSLPATVSALRSATAQADCVITTGGVSVGEADYVKQAVDQVGSLSLWKLAIKPGKPFSFGSLGEVPFFGLPGNPVAVFITFVTLVQPFLLKMQGATSDSAPVFKVRAGFSVSEPGTRQEYLRVRVQQRDGEPVAVLFDDQSSSVLTSLSWADGLAIVPVSTIVQAGQWLDYLPFKGVI